MGRMDQQVRAPRGPRCRRFDWWMLKMNPSQTVDRVMTMVVEGCRYRGVLRAAAADCQARCFVVAAAIRRLQTLA